jgi:AcrR family transcriptional regulator
VARPPTHNSDAILDAARDLIVAGGPQAATTNAISAASGAPTGSLYHRFGSRALLLAEVWLRTVRRFQDGLRSAADAAAPGLPRALAVADWTVEFAARHPADARLLLLARRENLLAADLPAATRRALDALNEPVRRILHTLAGELFGDTGPARLELVAIAVVDVPYATVRRHLRHGTDPGAHRDLVARAVRALLDG